MKRDPAPKIEEFRAPPLRGPGSGRAAWIEFARRLMGANHRAYDLVHELQAAVLDRDAEIVLLKQQIAERKPKGGRKPTPQETVDRIEHELRRGVPVRHAARIFQVSAMTVHRIKKRMRAREAAAE